jgi:hypothetical protein
VLLVAETTAVVVVVRVDTETLLSVKQQAVAEVLKLFPQ